MYRDIVGQTELNNFHPIEGMRVFHFTPEVCANLEFRQPAGRQFRQQTPTQARQRVFLKLGYLFKCLRCLDESVFYYKFGV